uniref:Mediator of RNA polymerase II transcription subunit 13 n=1 Tax=Taenia asiatica TaxID=60517 RepID=A0A0R3WDU3_TAEAS
LFVQAFSAVETYRKNDGNEFVGLNIVFSSATHGLAWSLSVVKVTPGALPPCVAIPSHFGSLSVFPLKAGVMREGKEPTCFGVIQANSVVIHVIEDNTKAFPGLGYSRHPLSGQQVLEELVSQRIAQCSTAERLTPVNSGSASSFTKKIITICPDWACSSTLGESLVQFQGFQLCIEEEAAATSGTNTTLLKTSDTCQPVAPSNMPSEGLSGPLTPVQPTPKRAIHSRSLAFRLRHQTAQKTGAMKATTLPTGLQERPGPSVNPQSRIAFTGGLPSASKTVHSTPIHLAISQLRSLGAWKMNDKWKPPVEVENSLNTDGTTNIVLGSGEI